MLKLLQFLTHALYPDGFAYMLIPIASFSTPLTFVQRRFRDNSPLHHTPAGQDCCGLNEPCFDQKETYAAETTVFTTYVGTPCSSEVVAKDWKGRTNEQINKRAYLTVCNQLWCRFHLQENAKQIITQWDLWSHHSSYQMTFMPSSSAIPFISFHLFVLLLTHCSLNYLGELFSLCLESFRG